MSSALGDKKGHVASSSDLTRMRRKAAEIAAYATYTGLDNRKKVRAQMGSAAGVLSLATSAVTTVDASTTGITINPISGGEVLPPYINVPLLTAPTITGFTYASESLTIYFTLGSDGGSAITNVYYSTDNGATWASSGTTASPITITTISADGVTPLTNGTEYLVRLVATTVAYDVPADNPSSSPSSVTPFGRPAAPVITGSTPGNGQINLTFTLSSTGGSPVTGIYYSTDDGYSWASSGRTASPITITTTSTDGAPLTNGTEYPVWLVAVTDAYDAPADNPRSSPSSVTPVGPPDAPAVSYTGFGDQSVFLEFDSIGTGGSTITNVYYSTDNGTSWAPSGTTTSPITITTTSTNGTPLTNGTQYTIRLVATTVAYTAYAVNPRSDPIALTPIGPPAAPVITGGTPGNGQINLTFTLSSTGGSPITDIYYSTDDGATWASSGTTASPITITTASTDGAPLQNDTQYPVRLVAITAVYSDPTANPSSSPAVPVTPTA